MPTYSIDDRESSNVGREAALQPLPAGIGPGVRVQIRGVRWRVERIVAREDCCELHVTSEMDDGRRVLLWPFDRPVPVDVQVPLGVVRLRTWWRALVTAAASAVGPFTPRAREVRAEVLPYQLEPAIAMARGALRILLADEVGLGKTVQAGWIIGDLIERQRDARVLIGVPAGLRRQWASELGTLFRLTVKNVDAAWLRATVADIPADVSPWSPPGIYLGSIDFLKRPDIERSLRSLPWDLLVVDEAHGAAAPTDRHAAIAAVARQARRVVSITATPFSGNASAFLSVAALGEISKPSVPPLMFRRSREDIGDRRRRRHRFASIRISRPEFRLQRLLERYSRTVWRESTGEVDDARLAVTILRKRALSSPAAAERSLRRRLALLQGVEAPRQLSLFDEEDTGDNDLMDPVLAAPGLVDAAREHQWLATMIEAAGTATASDSKLRHLLRLRERTRGEPAIVFTEYRDTLRFLSAAVPDCLQLHGGMTAAERSVVQRRFNDAGGWLLATDAAAEGLNLQQCCRLVVNYELPWNPARLEQRIGRVDRIGQHMAVHAVTLVAKDTAEDLVVANLMKRLARIAATLGDRDRLAAFLDDARVARSVIGVAERDPPGPPPDSTLEAVRSPPLSLRDEAAIAAAEIRSRAAAKERPICTPLTAVRLAHPLSPGRVVAFRCAALTPSGQIVGERLGLVHVRESVDRPLKASDVRRQGMQAIDMLAAHVESTLPDLAAWFESIEREHSSAIDAQIDREGAWRDRDRDSMPVQRGLFDRRIEAAADRQSKVEQDLRSEAINRIRDLECARHLQKPVSLAGVLLLWR
jgi:superfamily II DNA or RNA helicase